MPLYDFFRNMFGIPNRRYFPDDEDRNNSEYNRNRWQYRETDVEDDEDNVSERFFPETHFNVFSNPLEMHRYFEHQMNEMMKSFGEMFGGNDGPFFEFSETLPAIEPPVYEDSGLRKSNPRDYLLKPGYSDGKEEKLKSDTDLDGKIHSGDLDMILKGSTIKPQEQQPKIKFFSRSITTKTVRKPDGTVETVKTVRDEHGNEETTVTTTTMTD